MATRKTSNASKGAAEQAKEPEAKLDEAGKQAEDPKQEAQPQGEQDDQGKTPDQNAAGEAEAKDIVPPTHPEISTKEGQPNEGEPEQRSFLLRTNVMCGGKLLKVGLGSRSVCTKEKHDLLAAAGAVSPNWEDGDPVDQEPRV